MDPIAPSDAASTELLAATLADAIAALEHAARPGVLKVLLDCDG